MAERSYELPFEGYWRDIDNAEVPSRSGVYCVYECQYHEETKNVILLELIYIGESEDVNARIATHGKRPDWQRRVRRGNQLCYSFADFDPEDRERVEAALIFEHQPPENEEHKSWFPYERTNVRLTGDTHLLRTDFSVGTSKF